MKTFTCTSGLAVLFLCVAVVRPLEAATSCLSAYQAASCGDGPPSNCSDTPSDNYYCYCEYKEGAFNADCVSKTEYQCVGGQSVFIATNKTYSDYCCDTNNCNTNLLTSVGNTQPYTGSTTTPPTGATTTTGINNAGTTITTTRTSTNSNTATGPTQPPASAPPPTAAPPATTASVTTSGASPNYYGSITYSLAISLFFFIFVFSTI